MINIVIFITFIWITFIVERFIQIIMVDIFVISSIVWCFVTAVTKGTFIIIFTRVRSRQCFITAVT